MKKIFLAIILFLLMPIMVNAESYLCKYKLDRASTNAEIQSYYDLTDEESDYITALENITRIEVLREEQTSNLGKTTFTISFSYFINGNETKAASLDTVIDMGNEYHRVDGQYLINNSKFEFDYFNNYISNYDECPSNIIIYPITWGGDKPSWMKANGIITLDDSKDTPPIIYKSITSGSPIIDPNNSKTKECTERVLNCQKTDAIFCRKYAVSARKLGSGTLEFGNLDDGRRYIAAIFPGYSVGFLYNVSSGNSIGVDSYTFQIEKSLWNSLVIDDCNYRNVNLTLEESDIGDGKTLANIVIDTNKGGGGDTNPIIEIDEMKFCGEARVLRAFKIAGFLLFALKIIVPLIIIILGTVDFGKAVISTGDKANKDAINMLIKRLVIGIVIFLLPTILDALLGIIDGAKDTSGKFSDCTHCLFSPFSDGCNSDIDTATSRGVVGSGINNDGGSGSGGRNASSGSGGRGN